MSLLKGYANFLLIGLAASQLTGCMTMYQQASTSDPYWAPAEPLVADTSNSNPGAIFNPASAQTLFQDKKAIRVGDIITILLTESTNATKKADTELSKDSSNTMAVPTLFGENILFNSGENSLEMKTALQRAFKAESDSAQSNALKGTITVTVHQVYANGNLFIKGEKWIELSQGSEFIRVAGIIRPEDIDKDNQIISTRIANAKISYGGKGILAENNEPGWLHRFFNSAWWPF